MTTKTTAGSGLHYIRPAGLLVTGEQLGETVLPSPLMVQITQRHAAVFDDNSPWPLARQMTEVKVTLNLMLSDNYGTFPERAPSKQLRDSNGDALFDIAGDLVDGEEPASEVIAEEDGASALDKEFGTGAIEDTELGESNSLHTVLLKGAVLHGSEVREFTDLHLFDLLRNNPNEELVNHTILDRERAYATKRFPASQLLANMDQLVKKYRAATTAILEAQESPVAPANAEPGDNGELNALNPAAGVVVPPAGAGVGARPMVSPAQVEEQRRLRQDTMTKISNFFELNGTLVTSLSVQELHANPDIYAAVEQIVRANENTDLAGWLDQQVEALLSGAITQL